MNNKDCDLIKNLFDLISETHCGDFNVPLLLSISILLIMFRDVPVMVIIYFCIRLSTMLNFFVVFFLKVISNFEE